MKDFPSSLQSESFVNFELLPQALDDPLAKPRVQHRGSQEGWQGEAKNRNALPGGVRLHLIRKFE